MRKERKERREKEENKIGVGIETPEGLWCSPD